ncbi:MAG: HAD-IIB family hydrolase [Alphaproteobacteria bacterium]|nr:HAD-IIB family hydrolase [Alphaproteobacteria bacterium]
MNNKDILIFTDLDGSLLNHSNFEFYTIKPFILKCLRNNIRIIPNTSKTKNEVEFFSEQLGVDIPFIVENGSAIHNLDLVCSHFDKNIKSLILSRTANEIFEIFNNKVPLSLRNQCLFLKDMNASKQSKVLGLNGEQLTSALNRLYSIPLIFNGPIEIKNELISIFNDLDIKFHEGGRVINICDNCSKGDAMKIILKKMEDIKKKYHSIVIGDSPNDISMLALSNQPCVVPLPDEENLNKLKLKKVIRANQVAPDGWKEVVLKSLDRINFKLKEDSYG